MSKAFIMDVLLRADFFRNLLTISTYFRLSGQICAANN